MVNIKFVQKHCCSVCDTRFYDLNQTPATCPKCKTISLAATIPLTQNTLEEREEGDLEQKVPKEKEDYFFEVDPLEDTRELDDGEDLRNLSSSEGGEAEESN